MNTPIIRIDGDDEWATAYQRANALNDRFPNADIYNLCTALEYNEAPEINLERAVDISCEKQGENDEESWVWVVSHDDGTRYRVTGWCDYTGWDCRSWVEVEPLQVDLPDEDEASNNSPEALIERAASIAYPVFVAMGWRYGWSKGTHATRDEIVELLTESMDRFLARGLLSVETGRFTIMRDDGFIAINLRLADDFDE